jgi:two-component system chemotaxis response regulator CheB
MPAAMTTSYVKCLQRQTPFQVVQAESNAGLEPGVVYVGPGGMHIGLARTGRVVVSPKPQKTYFKPSIDVLFFTASRAIGRNAVAVVLTGLSAHRDAVEGASAVKKANGQVIVIDDPASKFLGMPKGVIDAGAATSVISLREMSKALTDIAG